MGLFSFIASIFKPATDLVDELHTSEEEKLTLRNELATVQEKANSKLIELEQARLDALARVEVAESRSHHWLRANWRPLTSLILVGIIMGHSFGLLNPGEQIYDLAKIFLGGYAGGRSLEKLGSVMKLGR